MEADRQIVRHFGEFVEGCTVDSGKFIIKRAAITGLACYVGFKITKKLYVNYTVKSAARKLQKELSDGQREVVNSIVRWKESKEYADLLEISQGLTVEEYITSLDFDQLVAALQSGEISAYSALKSYQIKALETTKQTNSVVAWILEADQIARDLDNLPKEQRKAFHGIPISVKECFSMQNTYHTGGMVYFYHNGKGTRNAPAVQTCLNLGAVPFCKTNIPQAMYSMECTNPLYGTTGNPHNPKRECGGSSGGEGAIIGGAGSILGLGSDIGGSLRSPAACCGIYSMKPTIGRHLSNKNATPTAGPGPARMEAIAGFMSSSPKALQYAWRTIYNLEGPDNAARFDTLIAPIHFSEERLTKKVRVGFFASEGLFEPVPGVKRAIDEANEILAAAGYEVVPIDPPNIQTVLRLFNGIVCADFSYLDYFMKWDVYSSSMRGLELSKSLMNMPNIVRNWVVNPLLRGLTKIPPLEKYYTKTSELYAALEERDSFTANYLMSMEEKKVDVIICPGQIVPALPQYVAGTFVPILFPYLPWNVLNMPAGIAPVTRYSSNDVAAMSSYPRANLTYKMIHRLTEGAEGLPLTVQVVAKPFHEEHVLQVLDVLHQNGSYK